MASRPVLSAEAAAALILADQTAPDARDDALTLMLYRLARRHGLDADAIPSDLDAVRAAYAGLLRPASVVTLAPPTPRDESEGHLDLLGAFAARAAEILSAASVEVLDRFLDGLGLCPARLPVALPSPALAA